MRETKALLIRGFVGVVVFGLGVAGWGPAALARGGGEDAKSPQAIYRDMEKALRSAQSLVIRGQGAYQDGSTYVETTSSTSTATHSVVTSNRVPVESVALRGGTYLRGGSFGTEWLLASRDPRCVQAGVSHIFDFAHVGTLSKGSVTTLGRRRVIEIDDDGKAPNATPMRVYVSLDGAPLPVRTVLMGAPTTGAGTCPLDAITASPITSGTEDWTFNAAVPAVKAPKPFIDGTVAFLAQATYLPAANTLSSAVTMLNAQFGQIQDPGAAQTNFQQTADAFRNFVAAVSTIKFPPAIQAEAQNLISMANNIATTTSNAAAAAGQGDANVVTTFNQQDSAFQAAQSTFETHLQQAL